MTEDPAIQALEECEGRLRDLVSDAAKAGNYESVERLTAWAKALRALAYGTVMPGSSLSFSRALTARKKKPSGRRGKARVVGPRGEHYPKFARLKGDLIKVGWSRRDKKEYQHKAPRHVAKLLAQQLMTTTRLGDVITTDQLFPLHDSESKADVPSYQGYVCLAWFRDRRLVEPVGRQGYRLLSSENLNDIVEREWEQLPVRISA